MLSHRHLQIRLLLIGNIKLWHIAVFYLVIDLISLSYTNVGGHIAHLGGALFGYLYASQLKKGTDITKGFTSLMDSIVNLFKAKKNTPFKKVLKNKTYTKQNKKNAWLEAPRPSGNVMKIIILAVRTVTVMVKIIRNN